MRGSYLRIAGIALSVGLWGLGCGDDTVSTDGPSADARQADRPAADAAADGSVDATSVTLAAVELHGTVPTATDAGVVQVPIMKAAVSIGASGTGNPVDHFSSGTFTNGCSAASYAVPSNLPGVNYNIGTITVTGYTGTANGGLTQTTVTCTYNGTGYSCDFPSNPAFSGLGRGVFLDTGNTHWLGVGDIIDFTDATGGAGIGSFTVMTPALNDNFTANSITACTGGTIDTTACTCSGTTTSLQTFPLNADLLIKFDCGGSPCGLVALQMSATNSSDPAHFAGASCTRLITSNTNCIKVPAGALQVLDYKVGGVSGWNRIQTNLLHFGSGFNTPAIPGAASSNVGGARGQVYFKFP
jgi:hypothetical protein